MRIRRFRKEDARDTSKCIVRALKETNSKHYPKCIINFLIRTNQPKNVAKRAAERETLVAESSGKIAGTINLTKDCWIGTFFVDPRCQGKGIGTKLLQAIERLAKKKNREIRTHCTINSVDFYKKNGYRVVKAVLLKDCGQTYRLFKRL